MRKPLLIITLLMMVIYACNQNGLVKNPLLITGKLPAQVFSIDITKDTTLVTKKARSFAFRMAPYQPVPTLYNSK